MALNHEQLQALNDEVRAQVAEELGEEFTQDERFQLLQKYGIAKPVLDKHIKIPNFKTKEEALIWKKREHDKNSMTLTAWQRLIQKVKPKQGKPVKKKDHRFQNHPRFSQKSN